MTGPEVSHVQGFTPGAWDQRDDDGNVTGRRPAPRPTHAVAVAWDGDGFDLAAGTVCGRERTASLEAYLPLAPWQNTAVEDRCGTCEALLRQAAVGLAPAVARYDATYG